MVLDYIACDGLYHDATFLAFYSTESGASEWTSLSRSKNTYNSYGAFRMLLWLAVYYSFYLQGVSACLYWCKLICSHISHGMHAHALHGAWVVLLASPLVTNGGDQQR